jgi:hypothetical protein
VQAALREGGQEGELSFHLGASFDSNGGAMHRVHNTSNENMFGDKVSVSTSHSRLLEFDLVADLDHTRALGAQKI